MANNTNIDKNMELSSSKRLRLDNDSRKLRDSRKQVKYKNVLVLKARGLGPACKALAAQCKQTDCFSNLTPSS